MYQRTGAPLHSSYALPQLCAFYKNQHQKQSTRHKVHKWQTIASLCLSRWVGTRYLPISYSEASWTGLLNYRSCLWDKGTCQLLPLECQAALPELVDFDLYDAAKVDTCDINILRIEEYKRDKNMDGSMVKNPYWARWSDLRFVRLLLGIGDGGCANIGSKCVSTERIAVTIGTSAAARICIHSPVYHSRGVYGCNSTITDSDSFPALPYGLFCYRINRSYILVGGALTDGGSVVEWARGLLGIENSEAFETLMEKVTQLYNEDVLRSIDSTIQDQTVVVPFLSGERSTGFRQNATGSVVGLTRGTTPSIFFKACLEGVILRIQVILHLLEGFSANNCVEPSPSWRTIIISGNALENNSLWRKMLADCSGMIVVKDMDANEGTSRGAALLATTLDSTCTSHIQPLQREKLNVLEENNPNAMARQFYWKPLASSQNNVIEHISQTWAS